jgi:hypothetical protein
MRVYGRVDAEVITATEFFLKQLIPDGRSRRGLMIEVIEDPSLLFAGITQVDDESVRPKEFTIKYNPFAGFHKIQVLGHECVHVAQFVQRRLVENFNSTVTWEGKEYHTGAISYEGDIEDAPPWEQEAYSKEIDLFEDWKALNDC